jgi:Kef-type K+ transport system membrane component KefB
MVLIFGIPPLSRRVRLPAAVGLLLSGVVVGPHVLGLFGEHRPVADFFADLGRLLLMFAAGLDMDLTRFRQTQGRSITFGLMTAGVPLLLGMAVGLLFGYGLIAAIVVGSLLASHTLLGSRVVAEVGANRLEPVTVTVGATLLSDTLSLVVFAICVSFRLMRAAFRSPKLQYNSLKLPSLFPYSIWAELGRRLCFREGGGSGGRLFRHDV